MTGPEEAQLGVRSFLLIFSSKSIPSVRKTTWQNLLIIRIFGCEDNGQEDIVASAFHFTMLYGSKIMQPLKYHYDYACKDKKKSFLLRLYDLKKPGTAKPSKAN